MNIEKNKPFPNLKEKLYVTDVNLLFSNILVEYYKKPEEYSIIAKDYETILEQTFKNLMRICMIINSGNSVKHYILPMDKDVCHTLIFRNNKLYLNNTKKSLFNLNNENVTSNYIFNVALSLTSQYFNNKNYNN